MRYKEILLLLIIFFNFFSCGENKTNLTEDVSKKDSTQSIVKLNINLLGSEISKQEGRQLSIKLPDGSVIYIESVKVEKRAKGFSWFGKVKDRNKSSVIITVEKGTAYGTVNFGRKKYRIFPLEPEKSLYIIEDISGKKPVPFIKDTIPFYPQKKTENLKTQGSYLEDGSKVDVLVLYTTAVKNEYGSGLEAFIQSLIDITNQSFQNSNINTLLNLAGISEINSVDETIPIETALSSISSDKNIENLRQLYKADIVVLVRKYQGSNFCGYGYVIVNLPDNFDQNLSYYISAYYGSGFSVVEIGSYGAYYCPDETFAHEVGHNFGSAHDRDHSSYSGAFTYSYGYDIPGTLATIMSYDSPTIRYFSNPDITYNGYPIGIPEGQPDSADNSKTINRTKIIVSNYISVSSSNPPSIDSFDADPTSGNIPLNVSFSWTVSDPDRDSLICNFDPDGDGIDDITVTECSSYSYNYKYNSAGNFYPKLTVSDGTNTVSKTLNINVKNNRPPSIPEITGIKNGFTNTIYTFSSKSIDPEGDDIKYKFDWGDGTASNWGSDTMSHSWKNPGNYCIKSQSKDNFENLSGWSDCFYIKISNPPINNPPEIESFNADPAEGYVPFDVTFSFKVKDMDGDVLICKLDKEGDGNYDKIYNNCTSKKIKLSYSTTGEYKATLLVSDGKDESRKTLTIRAYQTNNDPVIKYFSVEPLEIVEGDKIDVNYNVFDPEGEKIECFIDFGDNTKVYDKGCIKSSVEKYYRKPGEFTVTLTAMDSYGNSVSQKISITVKSLSGSVGNDSGCSLSYKKDLGLLYSVIIIFILVLQRRKWKIS